MKKRGSLPMEYVVVAIIVLAVVAAIILFMLYGRDYIIDLVRDFLTKVFGG